MAQFKGWERAGNVKTEALLKYFSKKKYNFNGVKNISENYFYNLKNISGEHLNFIS